LVGFSFWNLLPENLVAEIFGYFLLYQKFTKNAALYFGFHH